MTNTEAFQPGDRVRQDLTYWHGVVIDVPAEPYRTAVRWDNGQTSKVHPLTDTLTSEQPHHVAGIKSDTHECMAVVVNGHMVCLHCDRPMADA